MNDARYSLRRLNLLHALVQVMYWAAFASFSGFQTALFLSRGFTSTQAGLLAAVRSLAGIIAQPMIGGWADRHPKVGLRRILTLCLSLGICLSAVYAFTRPGFGGTVLMILALGMVDLNLYPLLDSMAVQFINAGVAVNYSFGRGIGSLAYALACVLLGTLSARLGVEVVLIIHIIFLFGLMAAVNLFPAPPKAAAAEKAEPTHSMLEILRHNRSFTLMLLGVFFSVASIMPVVNFLVKIIENRGGNEGHLGIALFIMAAAELPAALVFPWLHERFGSQRTMAVSVVFMALKPLVFLLTPSLPLLMAAQLIQLPGYGLFTPASVYYANESVPPADRVQGQAVMMTASNGLGFMAGNLMAGFIIDWGGIDTLLKVCCGVGAVGIAFALAALRAGNAASKR